MATEVSVSRSGGLIGLVYMIWLAAFLFGGEPDVWDLAHKATTKFLTEYVSEE